VELKFIGDRSSILGTIITSKNCAENDKNASKLPKNCSDIAFLYIVRIFLKVLRLVDWGRGVALGYMGYTPPPEKKLSK